MTPSGLETTVKVAPGAPKNEKGMAAAWRSPEGGGSSGAGWDLQGRAWLPPIERQVHDMHAQFFHQSTLVQTPPQR